MASIITKEHEAGRMDEELPINFFAHPSSAYCTCASARCTGHYHGAMRRARRSPWKHPEVFALGLWWLDKRRAAGRWSPRPSGGARGMRQAAHDIAAPLIEHLDADMTPNAIAAALERSSLQPGRRCRHLVED